MAITYQLQSAIALDNLQKQEKEIKSIHSARIWHLSELAHIVSDIMLNETRTEDSMKSRLSAATEMTNEFYLRVLQNISMEMALRDAYDFAMLLASRLLPIKEQLLREIIRFDEIGGIISISEGHSSKRAFLSLLECFPNISCMLASDIREACSAFRAQEAQGVLLPYMDDDGQRILSVHKIAQQNHLKLLALVQASQSVFALYAKGVHFPSDNDSSCFLQLELPAQKMPSVSFLADITKARIISSLSRQLRATRQP